MPDTPLLRYFRDPPYTGPKGTSWGKRRVTEAEVLLDDSGRLAKLFAESAAIVEATYRNYQPFYPRSHEFGSTQGVRHGDGLRGTVDVAARLSKREVWDVAGDSQLSFRYIDREIRIARSNPTPDAALGAVLKVDLFLANAHDRTPILCELKLRKDECALYALIQVLTQAAYAATTSQRERLVLFGSKPEFVLQEARPDRPATLDLYVLLVEKPVVAPWVEIEPLVIDLSKKLIADPLVGSRIGRIAWIEAKDGGRKGLTLTGADVATSKFRSPRVSRPTSSPRNRGPLNIDAGDNAEWTKQTLDLFVPDGQGGQRRVASAIDMRESLQASGMSVEAFKKLPASRLALRKQPWLRELQ